MKYYLDKNSTNNFNNNNNVFYYIGRDGNGIELYNQLQSDIMRQVERSIFQRVWFSLKWSLEVLLDDEIRWWVHEVSRH